MSENIRRPNTFIVGAPKCGTTSLAAWLSEHPQIFMSSPKEPNHFNSDLIHTEPKHLFKGQQEYEHLFDLAEPKHSIIGEATARYLYSSNALANIIAYNVAARIVVTVRNPIEMAVSLHGHNTFSGTDDVEDMETAWRLQRQREKGHFIPATCHVPQFLQYGAVCQTGEQVRRMYDLVPPEQRLVVVLDDLKNNPSKEWKKILRFLKVDDDGRTQFPVKNAAKKPRYKHVRTATRTVAHVKETIGLPRFRLGLLKRVDSINRREQPNAPISPKFRAELREYFRGDIGLLGELLERDFSGWLAGST